MNTKYSEAEVSIIVGDPIRRLLQKGFLLNIRGIAKGEGESLVFDLNRREYKKLSDGWLVDDDYFDQLFRNMKSYKVNFDKEIITIKLKEECNNVEVD